jgi:hypothetical protein
MSSSSASLEAKTIRVPVPNAAALKQWLALGVVFDADELTRAQTDMQSKSVHDTRTLRWMHGVTNRAYRQEGSGMRFAGEEENEQDHLVTWYEKSAVYDPFLTVGFSRVSKQSPEEQAAQQIKNDWSTLMHRYRITIESTAGCGRRGQPDIDRAHAELTAFAALHPEYQHRDQLPHKEICQDDGIHGMSSGLASMAQGQDECTVQ